MNFIKSNKRILTSLYDRFIVTRFILVPCQSIMLFFFMEVLGDQLSSLYSLIKVSQEWWFFLLALNLTGPILLFFFGFLPRYVNFFLFILESK
jgi:hypothetical protein